MMRRYLPPQHGAWAMLLLPYLVGLAVAGWRWPDGPLLGAWLGGYLLSYFGFQVVKARRAERGRQLRRFRRQLVCYAAVTVPLAVIVVAARPAVLWFAPGFGVLIATNAWFAARRRERALVNDLVLVVQSCLIMPVVAVVAGVPPHRTVPALLVVAGYFAGTVLYVKTMIRERGNPAYRRWSIGYHGCALALVIGYAGALAGHGRPGWYCAAGLVSLFGWLALRAWILPGQPLRPAVVGALETVTTLVILLLFVVAATVSPTNPLGDVDALTDW